MSKTKILGIFLGTLALCLLTACIGETVGYVRLKSEYAVRNDAVFAEIAALEDELASYTDEEAERYLTEAEAARMRTDALRNRIPTLKSDIEKRRSDNSELLKEKEYYSEIYNELLTGKEKVEGYITGGN